MCTRYIKKSKNRKNQKHKLDLKSHFLDEMFILFLLSNSVCNVLPFMKSGISISAAFNNVGGKSIKLTNLFITLPPLKSAPLITNGIRIDAS